MENTMTVQERVVDNMLREIAENDRMLFGLMKGEGTT